MWPRRPHQPLQNFFYLNKRYQTRLNSTQNFDFVHQISTMHKIFVVIG